MNWIKQFNWNKKKTINELIWHKQFMKALVNEMNKKQRLLWSNKIDNQSGKLEGEVVTPCDCKFCMDIIAKQFEKQRMLADIND